MRLVCEVQTVQGVPSDVRYAQRNVSGSLYHITTVEYQSNPSKNMILSKLTSIKYVKHNIIVFFKQRQEKGDNSYMYLP